MIAVMCQAICVVTLTKATGPADEITPVTPLLKKMLELPAGRVRDVATVTLKSQHDSLVAVNEVARSLARLVSAIGFVLFVVAWRAHTEARRRSINPPPP